MLRRLAESLGFATPPLLDGFTLSHYSPRLPVCLTCGVLVGFEEQRAHLDWHARSSEASS